jgi:hypothetical protein
LSRGKSTPTVGDFWTEPGCYLAGVDSTHGRSSPYGASQSAGRCSLHGWRNERLIGVTTNMLAMEFELEPARDDIVNDKDAAACHFNANCIPAASARPKSRTSNVPRDDGREDASAAGSSTGYREWAKIGLRGLASAPANRRNLKQTVSHGCQVALRKLN